MRRLLFIVEETFTIFGRGTILVPGVVPRGDEVFRVGDRLELRRPDGIVAVVRIDAFDMFNPGPEGAFAVVVALPKSEVPVGTAVWSVHPG